MDLQAVLFDLDGTLLDTAPDFVTTVNLLRHEEGLSPLPEQRIRATVSNGARALVGMAFDLTREDPDFDRLHQRLLSLYEQHLSVHTRPFPGIQAVLDWLTERQLPWGIVTNKSITYTQPLLEALALHPLPGTVICPDHVTHTKPHPEPLLLACKELGCEAANVVYVGDHLRDIDCGKRAGSITVSAAYGYIEAGDDVSQWQADYVIDQAEQLIDILNQLTANK